MRSKGEDKAFGFQFSENAGGSKVGRDSNPVLTQITRTTWCRSENRKLKTEDPRKESRDV